MSLSSKQASYLRTLIYPVQFERHPLDGVERVLEMIQSGEILAGDRAAVLDAIQAGLASEIKLAELLPHSHSEEAVRSYLGALARRLEDNA